MFQIVISALGVGTFRAGSGCFAYGETLNNAEPQALNTVPLARKIRRIMPDVTVVRMKKLSLAVEPQFLAASRNRGF